jgi:hypothetical protein
MKQLKQIKLKYCPPGFICIENMTIMFLLIVLFFVGYFLYLQFKQANNTKVVIEERSGPLPGPAYPAFVPNVPYNNFPADVLLDPYVPPLRDERYLVPSLGFDGGYYGPTRGGGPIGIPVNVSTNRNIVNTEYRQVGILTPMNAKSPAAGKILALLGRPLNLGRDTWNYYTMTDKSNSVKLPIIRKKKSCTGEYGCDRLYGGDVVFVQGYNQGFRVTMYDNDTIQYIPYL